jgi:hypothetical protein
MVFMASRIESGGFPWITYVALFIQPGPKTKATSSRPYDYRFQHYPVPRFLLAFSSLIELTPDRSITTRFASVYKLSQTRF